MKIKDKICKGGSYIQLVQDRLKWRILMSGVEASVTSIIVLVIQTGGMIHLSVRIVHVSYESTYVLKISLSYLFELCMGYSCNFLLSFAHVVNRRHEVVI